MRAWSLVLLWACSGPEETGPVVDQCDDVGEERLLVIQRLTFVRQEAGISDGFDLDGVTSPLGGPTGCGIADLSAPDGAVGVDNAFSYLLPALELTEAAAVEGLIQSTIDSGELLIALELSELDDPQQDECVDMWVGRAAGVPLRGTDGRLLSGQTFDPDADAPSIELPDVILQDGTFEMPVEMLIPVTIFDVSLDFALRDGRLRGQLLPDGTVVGLFAGGVEVGYLLQIALEENVDAGLHDVLSALLGTWSDLAPGEDGQCTQISMTFAFEAVPAFWFD
jgi:hypothetical protein